MRKRFRSGLLALVLPVFLSVFSGCTDMVRDQLDATQALLSALKKQVESANQELAALIATVNELDDGHTVIPDTFEETENGFKLSFKDGKTIEILTGHDGTDGRVLPIGVAWDEEQGFYAWTVDYLDGNGVVWLPGEDGKPLRAGFIDGQDGIVPEIKLEEDGWYLCCGEEKTKLAGLEELNGIGVFRDAYQDENTIYLEQWNGEVLKLSKYVPVRISFDGAVRDTVLIAGGERLSIPFEVFLEGNIDEQELVVTSGTDGKYFSQIVKGSEPGKDTVLVTAPAEFDEGYILLSAYCEGVSALKIITFKQREATPAEKMIQVRIGSGGETRAIPYQTNFPYRVVIKGEDASWLEVSCSPEADTLFITPKPNEEGDEIRTCEFAIVPEDNPDFIFTTFQVIQATDAFTISAGEGGTLTYEKQEDSLGVLYATAEGGDIDLWITSPVDLSVSVPEAASWLHATMTSEDGFQRLQVHVDPLEATAERREKISLQFKAGGFSIGKIDVIQAGATTGGTE